MSNRAAGTPETLLPIAARIGDERVRIAAKLRGESSEARSGSLTSVSSQRFALA